MIDKKRLKTLTAAIKALQEVSLMLQDEIIMSFVEQEVEIRPRLVRKKPGRPRKPTQAGHPWPGANEKEGE